MLNACPQFTFAFCALTMFFSCYDLWHRCISSPYSSTCFPQVPLTSFISLHASFSQLSTHALTPCPLTRQHLGSFSVGSAHSITKNAKVLSFKTVDDSHFISSAFSTRSTMIQRPTLLIDNSSLSMKCNPPTQQINF